jgi:UDP-N-acetylmuramoylalanine--D-glutamate ligase
MTPFKGKKVTLMGLGLLGRGIGDAIFLAKEGAEIVVTDLKSQELLKESVKKLKDFPNIKLLLGEHRLEDFRNKDFILKAAGVPLDSIYIEEARKNDIPIEMDASLFAKLAPGILIVGITGTRGKTTTTTLIYEILKNAYRGTIQDVFLAGNIRGKATLPLLDEVKHGDIVVMELDSWQLQGFGEAKISPHISVFTNFMNDHLNYYKGDLERYLEDKAQIFLHQKQKDYLVTTEGVAHLLTAKYYGNLQHPPEVVRKEDVPQDWKVSIPGDHNLENIALASKVAQIMHIPEHKVRETVENFQGVKGRLELVRTYNGVKIYNDTTATTPDATIAALKALAGHKSLILIMGGADKGLDMSKLIEAIPEYCKHVIFLKGTGTDKLEVDSLGSLEKAFQTALSVAVEGDVILFSPAFASFGMFKNEYDRGDKFNVLVQNLK